EDTMKTIDTERSERFLPRYSVIFPKATDPIIQPTYRQLAIQPSSSGDRSKCGVINGMVPEKIAISKPKSNPPSEAIRLYIKTFLDLTVIITTVYFMMLS